MSEDNKNYWDEIEEKLKRIEQERQREKEELASRRERRQKNRRKRGAEGDAGREPSQDFLKDLKKGLEKEQDIQLDDSAEKRSERVREPQEVEKTSLDDQEMEDTLAQLWDTEEEPEEGVKKPSSFAQGFFKNRKKETRKKDRSASRDAVPIGQKDEPGGDGAGFSPTSFEAAIPEEYELDKHREEPVTPRWQAEAPPEKNHPEKEPKGEGSLTETEEERLRRAEEIEKRWTQKLDLRELQEAEQRRLEKLEVERFQLSSHTRPEPEAEKPEKQEPEDRLKHAEEIEKRWTQKLSLEDIQNADSQRRVDPNLNRTGEDTQQRKPLTEPYIRPKVKKEPVIPMTMPVKEDKKEPASRKEESEEDLWMFKTPPEIKKETLAEDPSEIKEDHLDLVWNVEETKKEPDPADREPEIVWNTLMPEQPELPELPEASRQTETRWTQKLDSELIGQAEGRAEAPPEPELGSEPEPESVWEPADEPAPGHPSEPASAQMPLPSGRQKDRGRKTGEKPAAFSASDRAILKEKVDKKLPFEKQMEQRKQRFAVKKAIWGQRFAKRFAVWSRREKALSGRVAMIVQKADIRIERFLQITDILADRITNKFWDLLDFAEQHKMGLLGAFIGLLVCAVGVTFFLGSITAYEYIYNGRVLGVVKEQDDVFTTIDVIGTKLGDAYETTIEIDKELDITFNMVRGLDLEIDDPEVVLNKLTYMKDIKAIGYAIYVEGEQIAILQNKDVADSILSRITSRYLSTDSHIQYVGEPGFAENVTVEEVDILLGDIEREDEVLEYMLTGAVEKQIHTVEKGQTFSEIATLYGWSQDELLAINPGVSPEKLQIGQEIVLTSDSPIVTVKTTEIATYDMPIYHETIYQDDAGMYQDEQKVLIAGVNGQEEVVARIIRYNGHEEDREILSSVTISEPVTAVVAVGTKERPKLAGTGTFMRPINGARVSSNFGSRWGRNHNGMDFAASTGTAIYAADGGTVTFAGYKGSFGYLVIINHGNGMETYYAHCSKLHVKAGQKVYKGQHIANVGNTGNSTGPHLHFEVRVNGTPKNPSNYIK